MQVDKILAYLRGARQTLLFSATFSPEVKAIAKGALREGYALVDTVRGEEDGEGSAQQTHSRVQVRPYVGPI